MPEFLHPLNEVILSTVNETLLSLKVVQDAKTLAS